MNILHYTIGLPPTRHGGSVQYAYDLMLEQKRQGHNVFALVCGDTLFRGGISRFKKCAYQDDIPVYELTDPLTPTLIYGVSDPDAQHRESNVDIRNIKNFITKNKIDILHLHTLMGIHSEVVKVMKRCGVKIIYTSHDFHGICPHYNLINQDGELCDGLVMGEKCVKCNMHEPSDKFLRLANSHLYHLLKRTGLISAVKKAEKVKPSSKSSANITVSISSDKIKKFDNLIEYYRNYFRLIDCFHFNSSQTREKFEQSLGSLNGVTIPVVTAEVKDLRRSLDSSDNKVFGFVGSLNEYKGFPILKQVAKELISEGIDGFRIKVYGSGLLGVDEECHVIEYCKSYSRDELSDVLYNLDSTIVPSKWYETFSLVTLESLAHGRPAIVSDHVGAKDVVSQVTPDFVFSTKDELKTILKKCIEEPRYMQDANNRILSIDWLFDINNHTAEILKLYSSIQ